MKSQTLLFIVTLAAIASMIVTACTPAAIIEAPVVVPPTDSPTLPPSLPPMPTPIFTLTHLPTFTSTATRTFTPAATSTPTPLAIVPENAKQVILLNRLSDLEDANGLVSKSLAFSPDGKFLAVGFSGDNQTVRIWDVDTGLPLGNPLTGLNERVNCLDFSPDGTLLAAGSNDGTIHVWNVKTGREIWQPIEADYAAVNSVDFSPDGTLLASGNFDNKINLWDVKTGQKVGDDLLGHTSWVNSVAFSPDGTLLASGAQDHTIRLWDVETGQLVTQPLGNNDAFTKDNTMDHVIFSPDGTLLLIQAGKFILIWDIKAGQLAGKPIQESEYISSMALSPDGSLIVVGLLSARMRIWDVETRKPAAPLFTGHNDEYIESFINGMAFSPNGWWLASASGVNEFFLWGIPRWDTAGTPTPIP